MTTYAVIGGTFDPVHLGHLSIARDVLEQTEVDEVIFMPAKLQPFKLDEEISSFEERYTMLKIACAERDGLSVSRLEKDLEGVSYTYRTLDELRERLKKDDELWFITGSDTFTKLDTWTEAEHLLRTNSFIACDRPGYPVEELEEKRQEYFEKYGTRSVVINNERLDISSTMIRERVREGRPIDKLVTPGVEKYKPANGLYKQD